MKVKPTTKRGHVVVELDRKDEALLAEGAQSAGRSPFKLKKILVPVDFSECSKKALHYAIPFARQFEASLTLLELAAREVGKDLRCESLVRVGRVVSEIVDVARQTETDLIILSTHGHTGFKHVLLGSVAENVVRHAPCPVLIVRQQEHEFITK